MIEAITDLKDRPTAVLHVQTALEHAVQQVEVLNSAQWLTAEWVGQILKSVKPVEAFYFGWKGPTLHVWWEGKQEDWPDYTVLLERFGALSHPWWEVPSNQYASVFARYKPAVVDLYKTTLLTTISLPCDANVNTLLLTELTSYRKRLQAAKRALRINYIELFAKVTDNGQSFKSVKAFHRWLNSKLRFGGKSKANMQSIRVNVLPEALVDEETYVTLVQHYLLTREIYILDKVGKDILSYDNPESGHDSMKLRALSKVLRGDTTPTLAKEITEEDRQKNREALLSLFNSQNED